jgi:hypothetical protein
MGYARLRNHTRLHEEVGVSVERMQGADSRE